jgi:mannose-6-phosphate isomerase-like protein (cupin superfamily)
MSSTSADTAIATAAALPTWELAALVREIAADEPAWQPQVRFGTAERWWTKLRSDDLVDVWLLTWLRGSGTDLHDHGGSKAAFTVVEGMLNEVRAYPRGNATTISTVRPGGIREVAADVVHDVRNPSSLAAISIHAYSPPLQSMTFYDSQPSGLRALRTVPTDSPEPSA